MVLSVLGAKATITHGHAHYWHLKANLHTCKMSRQIVEIHSTFLCSGNFRFRHLFV